MSLITVNNLYKAYEPVDIFQDISFAVPPHARLAIVGPNGVGKTTLLRILTGEEPESGGQVMRARNLRFGYLPQEASFVDAENSLWEECLTAFGDLLQIEAELQRLEQDLAGVAPDPAAANENLLERYGKLQAEFEHRGGYTYINRIQQVLTGLGFNAEEFQQPLAHLSGGQRTRALLARLLLSNPDLLILDEPTNHLDIQAVEWLENYLLQWDGAGLIVSPDRYFMVRVAGSILELSKSGMEVYRGNYSAYLNQRQERWRRRQQTFEDERQRLLKEVEYIKRNIAGQNTLQAKGRLRRLTRYLQAVEQVGMESAMNKKWAELSEDVLTSTSPYSVEEAEKRVRGLRSPIHRPPELHLRFRVDQRSGNIVLRAHELRVGYPGKPLFGVEEIELHRLECVALIGPNGAGKTTFLKTILGQLAPLEGEVSLGASLDIGYFAQAHEGLQADRTLMQEISAVAGHMLPAQIRDYLAKFLFSGEDVFKKVEMLSGGERGRLALAKLALGNANLLLLDEPTNHLDIPSQEILQDVLANFQGTIMLVSHDRYLIDALATQVWEIDEAQNILHVFKGSYSEYRAWKEAQALAQMPPALVSAPVVTAGKGANKSANTNEERRRRARIQELEKQIGEHEAQLKHIEQMLENPPAEAGKVQKLGSDYLRLQKEIENLMEDWSKLHE